jgi:transcription elongation factor S-II
VNLKVSLLYDSKMTEQALNFREKIIEKFNSIINNQEISEKLEKSIFEYTNNELTKKGEVMSKAFDMFKKIYLNKSFQLYNNIDPNSPIKNPLLLDKILNGTIDINNIASMTPQEIFPEHWEKLQEKQKATDEFLYLKKPEAATDEYKCSRCKERKCTYYELQTRSIDEPMTKFVRCLVCDHRWRMSG